MSKFIDKQKLIEKYAKKFASKEKMEITRGIYYAPSGDVIVTNRFYLLRVRNAHNLKNPIIMHHKTGMPIDGVFPDTSRAFPLSRLECIKIKQFSYKDVLTRVRCAADVAIRLNKKFPVISLKTENGNAFLVRNEDHIQFNAFLAPTQSTKSTLRKLNAEYLHTGLSVFVDADVEKVLVYLNGPNDPILLTDEEHIDVLILPYKS